MFGIIGAMEEEVRLILEGARDVKAKELASMLFYSGTIQGQPVVVVKCGVGKVNAAACAQAIISVFGADRVILTGVAGAVDENLDIGDVVVSSDCVQYDVDASALGYEPGQICFTDLKFFKADERLVEATLAAAAALNVRCVEGRILTGDKFITDSSGLAALRKVFGGSCIEMEGAAVAHVCVLNKVPFVIIRSISDRADHSAAVDFKKFVERSAAVSSSIVREILGRVD